MGILETKSAKRTRNKNIQKTVLKTVQTVGLLSIALVAPNVLGALVKLGYRAEKRDKESIARAQKRLIEKGWVKREGSFLRVTEEGKKALRQLEISEYNIEKPKWWDKKWRVLIFDIPEYRKNLREKIRRTLTSIGFVRLQDSVWVYPYNCENLIALLKADFKVGKDVLYLIVDTIENDSALRKQFGLP